MNDFGIMQMEMPTTDIFSNSYSEPFEIKGSDMNLGYEEPRRKSRHGMRHKSRKSRGGRCLVAGACRNPTVHVKGYHRSHFGTTGHNTSGYNRCPPKR